MIFNFADGNTLEDIQYITYHNEGCPTCGFGDEIIHDFDLITTHYKINISTERSFDAEILIKILANPDLKTYTEKEFVDSMYEKFYRISECKISKA